MNTEEAMRALRNCDLFTSLSDEDLHTLAPFFEMLEGGKGDVLYEEGDPASSLFVVAEGKLAIRVQGGDGTLRAIREAHPGDSFGEVGLLAGGNRWAGAVAESDVRVLSLDDASFSTLTDREPKLAVKVLRAIGRSHCQAVSAARDIMRRVLLDQVGHSRPR